MVGEGTIRAPKGGKQATVLTSFDAMKHMKYQHDMIVLRVLEWHAYFGRNQHLSKQI